MKRSEHGMLDGIKSKLGFADAGDRGYDDDGYYDDYGERADDYDDYGEGVDEYSEYGPDYHGGDASESHYDPYAPVTMRPAQSRSSSRADAGMPKLVSIDDVRAHTQIPDSLNRDPLPSRRVTSTARRGERTVVDDRRPAPSSPSHTATARERSEGLDSLFSPTTGVAASDTAAFSRSGEAPAARPGARPASADREATGSFDPYDAYAGTGAAAHNPSRSLSVLKPSSYGEAELVAKQLRAGDVVVLALRNTPDNLAKRILDFSFGVSSALDARVECIADKVFALTRGAELTEAERVALRNQGVL